MENFEDMEMDVQPAKGQYDTPKRKKSTTPPADTRTELEKKVMDLYPQYNVNSIASMLMIPSQQVKAILEK